MSDRSARVRRLRRRWWLVVSAIVTLWEPAHAAPPDDPANPHLTVIDGDTLEYGGRVLELADIDAPELGQFCLDGAHLYACGIAVAFELKKILALETAHCVPVEGRGDRYECQTPNNQLGLMLVESGLAIARNTVVMKTAESNARQVPLGIWRGSFVDPGEWRDGLRLPEERKAGDTCPVLGVRLSGDPTYIVPTDSVYELWRTRTEEIERRFCSDEAARADGYRHLAPGEG